MYLEEKTYSILQMPQVRKLEKKWKQKSTLFLQLGHCNTTALLDWPKFQNGSKEWPNEETITLVIHIYPTEKIFWLCDSHKAQSSFFIPEDTKFMQAISSNRTKCSKEPCKIHQRQEQSLAARKVEPIVTDNTAGWGLSGRRATLLKGMWELVHDCFLEITKLFILQ